MHRDEVKIFRGNVETHLRGLERASHRTGAPRASIHVRAEQNPTAAGPIPQLLEYRRGGVRDRLQRLRFLSDAQVLGCLAGMVTLLFAVELGRGESQRPAWSWIFGGGGVALWLALAAVALLKRRRAQ